MNVMAKWMLLAGWIALVVNGATNGLAFVLATRNSTGFYALNVTAIVLGGITLGMQLRDRAAGRNSNWAAMIAFAVLLVGLAASWIVMAHFLW